MRCGDGEQLDLAQAVGKVKGEVFFSFYSTTVGFLLVFHFLR